MKFSKTLTMILISTCVFFTANKAFCGIYSDDMARCLVESTSKAEKNQLIRWMFSAISTHPALTSMSSVSTAEREKTNKDTADLFVKLLTETCREKTIKAVKFEGQDSIKVAFEVLGRVAAQGIFSDPSVAKEVANLGKFADKEKLKEIGLE